MMYAIINTDVGYLLITPYLDTTDPLRLEIGVVEVRTCDKEGNFVYTGDYTNVVLDVNNKRVIGTLLESAANVVTNACDAARTDEFMLGARNAAIMHAHLSAVKNLGYMEAKLLRAKEELTKVNQLASNAGITDQTDAQVREIERINRR